MVKVELVDANYPIANGKEIMHVWKL
jgi:hypothetical protein